VGEADFGTLAIFGGGVSKLPQVRKVWQTVYFTVNSTVPKALDDRKNIVVSGVRQKDFHFFFQFLQTCIVSGVFYCQTHHQPQSFEGHMNLHQI
jgi:hypothetical protein